MLTIREDQLASLASLRRQPLHQSVAARLRARNPERARVLGGAGLGALIDEAFAEARRCGFARNQDLAAFAALAFSLGPRFHEQTAVRRALTDPRDGPADRLARLPFRVSSGALEEAAALSGPFWRRPTEAEEDRGGA